MSTPSDLAAPRSAGALRGRLVAFWRWWSGEISQLALERFSALRGAASVPLIAFDSGEVVLVEPRALAGPDSRLDLAALDEARVRAAFRGLLERAGETRQRARLGLGNGEALVRRITMPTATEENLRQVLAYEMDRLTPFRAEEVYFDYRVLSRDAAAGQLAVQIAVARRELVDARVAKLRELGANVQGVAVRGDSGSSVAPLDLLPLEQHGERETARERLVQRGLVGAVAILLLLALAIPIWRKRETVIALQPLVGKAKQEAEATDALARQLERQVNDYNFLLAKKHANHPVLAFVEEVSRLLPDTTWVQLLEVKTAGKMREIQISGETTSSSKLIEILEQSKLLQNATPRGTVTRGSTPNSERFMIVAEASPRPQPEATPVLGSAAPQPAPVTQPPAPPSADAGKPASPPATPPKAQFPTSPPATAPGK
jgi:general secretion pathway protein L